MCVVINASGPQSPLPGDGNNDGAALQGCPKELLD